MRLSKLATLLTFILAACGAGAATAQEAPFVPYENRVMGDLLSLPSGLPSRGPARDIPIPGPLSGEDDNLNEEAIPARYLPGGQMAYEDGTTDYNQYLRFEEPHVRPQYENDDSSDIDPPGILFVDDADVVVPYNLRFEESAQLESDNDAEDLGGVCFRGRGTETTCGGEDIEGPAAYAYENFQVLAFPEDTHDDEIRVLAVDAANGEAIPGATTLLNLSPERRDPYPRIGQEIGVEFFDGDPDRPIINGRVYNSEESPPYALLPGTDSSPIDPAHDGYPRYEGQPRTQPEQEPNWSEEDQQLENSARDDYYETLRRHADDQASIEVEETYDELRRYRR